MKTFPVGLDALLATRQFVFADLYDITLADPAATHLRYTTADTDVVYNGNLYTAKGPFFSQIASASRAHWKAGVDLDTWSVAIAPKTMDEITGTAFPAKIFNQPWLTAARVGALNGAVVDIHRVYWPAWPARPFASTATITATGSTSWDPTAAAYGGVPTTFSNGNRTVTSPTGYPSATVRSGTSQTNGKYYWEITVNNVGGGDSGVSGICTSTQTLIGGTLSQGTGGFGMFEDGTIWYNGGNNGGTGAGGVVTGDVWGFAVDIPNRKFWVRRNGGSWFGNAIAGDPATNSQGYNWAGLPGSAFYAACEPRANSSFTANFGQQAFVYTAPVGFGNWPGTTPTGVSNALIAQSGTFPAVGSWAVSAATLSNVSPPGGSVTARKLTEDTTLNTHYFVAQVTASGSTQQLIVHTIYAKGAGRAFYSQVQGLGGHYLICVFDLANGIATGGGASGGSFVFLGATCTTDWIATGNSGNGWYKCTLWGLGTPIPNYNVYTVLYNMSLGNNYLGDGTSGVLFWNPITDFGYTPPSQLGYPLLDLFAGRVADVDITRTAAIVSINSFVEQLKRPMPRNLFQSSCRWTLFDAGCGISAAPYTFNGTVTAKTNDGLFNTTLSQGVDYFTLGRIVWLSGNNYGFQRGIRQYFGAGGQMQLISPMPYSVQVGDTFTAYAGCDKTMGACSNKFSNLANFGGFPFIPIPEAAV